MYRRRLHREFPYFFNYVIFQVLTFAVEFPLRHWINYYYVYWTCTALSVVVSFAVLLEIFKDAFRPYEALRDLSLILFRWCALVVLLVAGMWAITSWRATPISITLPSGILPGESMRPHDAVRAWCSSCCCSANTWAFRGETWCLVSPSASASMPASICW